MARGWESKAIEDQQQEAERRRDAGGPRESSATDRRRTLELARAQTARQLALARTLPSERHSSARLRISTLSCSRCPEGTRHTYVRAWSPTLVVRRPPPTRQY